MGMGGHMLGAKKLRRLSRLSGLDLFRAYTRNHYSEGVVRHPDGGHTHYWIDPKTGENEAIPEDETLHWSSCSLTAEQVAQL